MTIDQRLAGMEAAMHDVRETNSRIADALERLVILETQHGETRAAMDRAFKAIEKHAERIADVEKRLPMIDLILKGAGIGVLGTLGLIGTAIWAAITRTPS